MISWRMIGYCLISLAIGVGITFESYGLFVFLMWRHVFFLSYIVPEVVIGLFCFVLKRKYKWIWGDKEGRFLCLGFLVFGFFIASLAFNINYYPYPGFFDSVYEVILASFVSRFLFGFIFYPIAIAVSVYATGGIKGWRRLLAVIILSIFIFWSGPFFIPA